MSQGKPLPFRTAVLGLFWSALLGGVIGTLCAILAPMLVPLPNNFARACGLVLGLSPTVRAYLRLASLFVPDIALLSATSFLIGRFSPKNPLLKGAFVLGSYLAIEVVIIAMGPPVAAIAKAKKAEWALPLMLAFQAFATLVPVGSGVLSLWVGLFLRSRAGERSGSRKM